LNAQGFLVKEENILPNKINSISLEELPKGLYFIQTMQNKENILQNFIKL